MPRRGSGAFRGWSAPRAASRAAPVRNPPQPATTAPPPAPVQPGGGSKLGGLRATVADAFRGWSAPRAASRAAPVRNPPQPATTSPPPAPVQPGGGSKVEGLGATVADGFTFGTGNSVARRAVDAVMGPRVIKDEPVVSVRPALPTSVPTMGSVGGSDACSVQSKAFQDCMNNYGNDISKCQYYMEMLSECRKSSAAVKGV